MGFPDINTLEPLARALDITLFELMYSQKDGTEQESRPASEVVELMNKAVEMEKENQRRKRVSRWLGVFVCVVIAILVKGTGTASIGGAVLVGAVAALAVITLYFYVNDYRDRQSRRIYGSFMLLGTLFSILLFQLAGIGADRVIWLIYGMFAVSVLLTYK